MITLNIYSFVWKKIACSASKRRIKESQSWPEPDFFFGVGNPTWETSKLVVFSPSFVPCIAVKVDLDGNTHMWHVYIEHEMEKQTRFKGIFRQENKKRQE